MDVDTAWENSEGKTAPNHSTRSQHHSTHLVPVFDQDELLSYGFCMVVRIIALGRNLNTVLRCASNVLWGPHDSRGGSVHELGDCTRDRPVVARFDESLRTVHVDALLYMIGRAMNGRNGMEYAGGQSLTSSSAHVTGIVEHMFAPVEGRLRV